MNHFGNSVGETRLFRFGPMPCNATPSWPWPITSLPERRLHQASMKKPMCTKNKPTNSLPTIHFTIGCSARRLQDLGMTALAEKHFQLAGQLGAEK